MTRDAHKTALQTNKRTMVEFKRKVFRPNPARPANTRARKAEIPRATSAAFVSLVMIFFPFFLAPRRQIFFGDFAGQSFELFAVKDSVVDHPQHEGFCRASAEAVNDVLYGPYGDILALVARPVDECAAFDLVSQIALLLQTAEHSADRRVFHGTRRRECLTTSFCSG